MNTPEITPQLDNQGSILLVADANQFRQLLAGILTRAGYRVQTAESGDLARAAVATSPPDLILLDTSISGMEVSDFFQQLRKQENHRDIPVIFIGAFAEVAPGLAGSALHAVDFISRPFTNDELLARVHTHVALRQARMQLEQQAQALRAAHDKLANEIHERQRTEEELRESLQRYRSLFDQANVGIFIMSMDGKILELNQAFADMHGYSMAELANTDIRNLDVLEEHALRDRSAIIRRLQAGKTVHFEVEHFHKDGHIFPLHVTTNIINLNGKRCYQATHKDITERKRVEEVIRASEAKYRTLVETTGTGYVILDAQGRVLDANREYVRLTGHGALGDIRGRSVLEWTAAEAQPRNAAAVEQCVKDRSIMNFVTTYVDGNGKLTPVEINATVEGEGESLRIVSLCRDITERQRAADALARSNEQLYQANNEKNRYISIIAHDLRNPFTVILGYAELLVEQLPTLPPNELEQITRHMHQSAVGVDRLLTDLLEWSAMQQGRIAFNPQRWPLAGVVASACDSCLVLANRKGIAIVLQVPEDIHVMADWPMLETVFRNLVGNAVKFTPHAGTITVAATIAADHAVTVAIQDTGIGMSREMIANLFRPDQQTKRKGTDGELSSGLGLFICEGFIKRHGGVILVESSEGRGTTVRFTLPAAPPEESRT